MGAIYAFSVVVLDNETKRNMSQRRLLARVSHRLKM
jgi:hypothetical protein